MVTNPSAPTKARLYKPEYHPPGKPFAVEKPARGGLAGRIRYFANYSEAMEYLNVLSSGGNPWRNRKPNTASRKESSVENGIDAESPTPTTSNQVANSNVGSVVESSDTGIDGSLDTESLSSSEEATMTSAPSADHVQTKRVEPWATPKPSATEPGTAEASSGSDD